jgi:ABC-type multidrug transport system fused ATPase/permease subunit
LFYNATVNGLQDSDEDTFFLIYTSFRFTVLEYKNSLDGMKDCEINRTSDMEELCIMFITSIGVAMAFFYIILGFFIILINKKIKELWTYVFEKVQFSEKATKQMAKFRLQEVHKVKEFEEEDQNELKNEVFNGHWKRNMGVLTIMFMFAVGFYMTFYYEFIRDIVDLIAFRIIFADILNSRRAGVLHTAYFTQDIAMGNRTNGSYDHFHNFTLFPSSETMFNRINSDMASLRKFYFTDNFKQKTPNAVIDVIFKSFNSPKPNLQRDIQFHINFQRKFFLSNRIKKPVNIL